MTILLIVIGNAAQHLMLELRNCARRAVFQIKNVNCGKKVEKILRIVLELCLPPSSIGRQFFLDRLLIFEKSIEDIPDI